MIRALQPFLAALRAARPPPDEAALTEVLYQQWFIDWRAPADLGAQASGDDRFVAALMGAAGTDTWLSPGWTVTGRVGGNAFVSDGAVQLYVDAAREVSPRNPREGAKVAVRLPCARGCATPGFFLLVSRAGRAPAVHDKLYLHLTPQGGTAVVERLRRLDARFEVKVANSAAAYGRRDSGVVYVDPAHRPKVARALLALSNARPHLFGARVPPMTSRLGRGISFAESHPDDGEGSFGEERCRLVARALLSARKGGALGPHLRAVFFRAGVDPAEPWLRASKA